MGVFSEFVQTATLHQVSDRFKSMMYNLKKGVRVYKAELQWWSSRMMEPPMTYNLKKKFLSGLPHHLKAKMIDDGASPDLSGLN